MLKRMHLFEFSDKPWVTGWVREGFMDCLATIYRFAKPYDGFAAQLAQKFQGRKVFDLSTGTGESIEFLLKYLKDNQEDKNTRIIGTDLFPNGAVLEIIKQRYLHFDYINEPVNALNPCKDGNCSYTMFTAFHHFKPDAAVEIIRSCLSNGSDLTVFEFTSRHSLANYITAVVNTIQFMFVPFLAKKWRWRKFIFSTLIPIIPLMYVFDAIVSNLRTYTKEELEELAQKAFPEGTINVEYQEKRFSMFFKSYMCQFSLKVSEETL